MLGNFREIILSWGAKILLGLLIISFALWGIGDYTTGGSNNKAVAEVGELQITNRELEEQVFNASSRMRQILGQEVTDAQIRSMGIVEQTLNRMIEEHLFLEGAREAGLIITDQLLRQEIRNDRQFKSTDGQFDRNIFFQQIKRAGYNEASYSELYRKELLQKQLLSAFQFGISAPAFLAEHIYRYRNEKRVAKLIRIDHTKFDNVPDPTPAELAKYHKDNAATFTAPEYRSLTLLTLQPEDVADEIEVPEERIKEEYESRILEFSQKERRNIQQILVSNRAAADVIASRLNKGQKFDEVAKELANLEKDTLELGSLMRSQLPIKKLGDAAFLLATNTHSQPIKTNLGWHILRVSKIIPASRKKFPLVREELKRGIQLELAGDALVSLANRLEDELGSGASIDDAANRLNLQLEKIPAVDLHGLNEKGKPIKGISDKKEVLRVAFETFEGQDSALTDYNSTSYFILHVNKVTPSSVRPLEQIIRDVSGAWKRKRQSEYAEKRAIEFVAQLNNGQSPEDLTKKFKGKLVITKPFTRTGQGLQTLLPSELLANIFESKINSAVWAAGESAHFIAFITSVNQANITSDSSTVNTVRTQLDQGIGSDLTTQLAAALRTRLGVTTHRKSIEQIFPDGSTQR